MKKNKYYSLDRFEDDQAVLYDDNNRRYVVNIKNLPAGSKEGDCLYVESGRLQQDIGETVKRKKKVLELLNRLKKN